MNFTIFGKPNCPYCEMAKQLLTMRKKEFIYKELHKDYEFEDLVSEVSIFGKETPRTFPQIFVEGEGIRSYIGGFDKLREFMGKQID